jgi:hypothetical protein
MFLPDEIINLILSYREVNPTAKLIKYAFFEYEGSYQQLQFGSFYLSHLIYIKSKKYCDMRRKIQDKWENTINSITDDDDDDKIKEEYAIYKKECETECFYYTSYYLDFSHSLKCCNMINEEYFHLKNIYYKDYSLFENKYRNEIINGNKIMTKRKIDYPIELYDYVNRYDGAYSIALLTDKVNCGII